MKLKSVDDEMYDLCDEVWDEVDDEVLTYNTVQVSQMVTDKVSARSYSEVCDKIKVVLDMHLKNLC